MEVNRKRYFVLATVAMAIAIVFLVVLISVISVRTYPAPKVSGCFIDINKDFTFQHSLLLNTTVNEFILPNTPNGIRLSTGEKVRLACPGFRNHISNASSTVKEVIATCDSGTSFNVTNLGRRNFRDLKCQDFPDHRAKKTGAKCSGNFTEIGIGFEVSTGFVQIITICFDEVKKDSLYSVYNLSSKIGTQQERVPRPDDFIPASFYPGLPITSMYHRKNERNTLSQILSSRNLAEKYISLTNDYFMSRGHLTAKADFVYGSQQRATFYYVNVAPQWQTFNGENWNVLETSCRKFSAERNLDLTVYTGVFGKASLPDVNNKSQELYLYMNSNRGSVTVPELYWKILHEPKSQLAIGFVGHNNPYETDVAQRKICKTPCNVKWVPWKPNNITFGYSYCCDVRELQNIVKYIPKIAVKGLLL